MSVIKISEDLLRDYTMDERQADLHRMNVAAAARQADYERELIDSLFTPSHTGEPMSDLSKDTVEINDLISTDGHQIVELVVKKNTQYDCAVLHPAHVFATNTPLTQIKVRIDDKIKRLQNWFQGIDRGVDITDVFHNEDTIADLIGYLLLLRAVARWQSRPSETAERECTKLEASPDTQAFHREVQHDDLIHKAAELDERERNCARRELNSAQIQLALNRAAEARGLMPNELLAELQAYPVKVKRSPNRKAKPKVTPTARRAPSRKVARRKRQ